MSRLREGRNMDAYIRGETSSLLVSPTPHSLAGKEEAEDPDTVGW